jgi:hypothetical protein
MTTVHQNDALRSDIAQTRTELGGTVEELTAKTDVKTRVSGAARQAATTARDGSRKQAARVQQSVRQQPARWSAGAGLVALAAAAAVGAGLWQRSRRRPVNRATRAWQSVSSRFSR